MVPPAVTYTLPPAARLEPEASMLDRVLGPVTACRTTPPALGPAPPGVARISPSRVTPTATGPARSTSPAYEPAGAATGSIPPLPAPGPSNGGRFTEPRRDTTDVLEEMVTSPALAPWKPRALSDVAPLGGSEP